MFRDSSPENRAKNLKILFLALSFYFVFAVSNVSYLLPLYYADIGYDAKTAGWLVSVFYLASVTSRLFLANAVTSFGFRNIFLVAGVLSVVSSVGIAVSGLAFWPALLFRVTLGVCAALFQIGLATYQAVAFKENERGNAFSLIMAGGLAPMMTAVPLADWLLHHGFSKLYILLPLALSVGAACITPAIPGLKETKLASINGQKSVNPLLGVAACWKLPFFRLALFSMLLFTMIDATCAFMSPMTNSFGLMASYFLSFNAIVGVCIRLFFGKLLDRFPRWLLSTPILLLMSALLFLATISPTEKRLIILGLCFGVGMGFGFPLNLALVSDAVTYELQPYAVAVSWFVMGLNFALIPMLMGWLSNLTGPVVAFRCISGFIFIGSVFLGFLWFRRWKARKNGDFLLSE